MAMMTSVGETETFAFPDADLGGIMSIIARHLTLCTNPLSAFCILHTSRTDTDLVWCGPKEKIDTWPDGHQAQP